MCSATNGRRRSPYRSNGFRLRSWVHVLRLRYLKGKLSPDRVARLESLKGWSWDVFDDKWEEGLSRLVGFVHREGHTRVPQKHPDETFRLG
jgi:hypothetical protein